MVCEIRRQVCGQAAVGWAARTLRGVAVIFTAGLLVSALGCTTTPALPPQAGAPASYIVGAPDALFVQILPDPVVEHTVTVRPDGMITIPLLGDIPAGGRTISGIATDIEQRMGRFKKGARVSVALVGAMSTDVTILGEVGSRASFPLVKATRIIEAIGQVGGVTNFASAGKARIVRVEDGQTVVHKVNIKAIRGGDLSTNMMLKPGDIIYVPPTFLAKVGYVLQQLLFPLQPVMGVARMANRGMY